jgi:serine/threonine protein kinase
MAIDHPYDALPLGYRLNHYEILRLLGRGGFGLTYQARRIGVAGDMVAIKELFPAQMARRATNLQVEEAPGTNPREIQAAINLFLREAQIICHLKHPNIVRGIESFEANGTAYLVMRYVSGKNLRDSLRDANGFRPNAESLPALIRPLLDALETLHRNNLLHGDIKPDNIFLGVGFEPILIDLGSARWHVPELNSEDSVTYSRFYSAAEQMEPQLGALGPWTDIYQLAAVLYRCITGGKIPDAVERLQAPMDPYLPLADLPEVVRSYPRQLIQAIDTGLRLHPDHRPRSAAEWQRSFASLLSLSGTEIPLVTNTSSPLRQAPPPPPPIHPPLAEITPDLKSSPDLLLWLGGGLLILILILIFFILTNT